MNAHIKEMLMLTAVVGLSSPSVAMANCRGYNSRTWYRTSRTAATNGGGGTPSATSVDSKSKVARAPQIERRSYSYEPSMSSGRTSHRSAKVKKDPWQYPKSDPRRYQVH